MTNTNVNYANKIAITIQEQLGGAKFTVMTGAKYAYGTNSQEQAYLNVKLPKMANKKINNVKITYNEGMDVYEMAFLSVNRNCEITTIEEYKEVYCDQLIELFEKNTGLYCSL